MNTTRHTFSVTHCDNYENTGNCKTLAAAQSLANKHGSHEVFIRSQERTTKTDTLYMVFVPYTGWTFIDANEADFAKRATPSEDKPNLTFNHLRNISVTTTNEVMPTQVITDISETATVYSMDVARVVEDKSTFAQKASLALAAHLGLLSRLAGEGLDDLAIMDYPDDDLIDMNIDGEEWIVCQTDARADDLAERYISESLWAFNASFLSEQTGLPIEVFEAIQANDKCEDNNSTMEQLIPDVGLFAIEACRCDGRGHFISGYDGDEVEINCLVTGETYYAYRVN